MPKAPDSSGRTHLRLVKGPAKRPATELVPTAVSRTTSGPADQELEWFFTMAESDMGARSNFYQVLDIPESSMEDRADASHAQRIMLRRFVEVGDHDAGVLKAAYMARPWPLALREELGRVTGVVVRLASADIGLPEDDKALDALERRTADWLNEALARKGRSGIERFRPKASALLQSAFLSYVRERGGPRVPVLRGIT